MKIVHKLSLKEAFSVGIAVISATLPFTTHAQTNCVTPPSGLVSWWRAESNTTDTVSGNNGALSGNAIYGVGRVTSAFVFDGSSDAVPVGNPANLQLQNFTIEAWIKRGSSAIASLDPWGDGAIFDSSWGGYSFAIRDDGRLQLGKIGYSSVSSTLTVSDTNSFHHVAVTKSGSSVTLYVDGVGDSVGPYDPGFEFGGPFAVGARGGDYVASFLGSIDEVSVYSRALSAVEIQSVYNAGNAGKCLPPVLPTCAPAPSGLISWWRAESNTTDTVGTNHGTISGGVTYIVGEVGSAFSFDGTGEVSVASTPSLNVQSFTIETWVNPSIVDNDVDVILNKENNPASSSSDISYEFGIRGPLNAGIGSIPAGHFVFFLGGIGGLPDNYGGGWVDGGAAVTMNSWSHCAVAFDGTSVRVYINGTLTRAINGLSGALNSTTGPFKIGSRSQSQVNSSPAVRFNGLIDELSLFNRALSEGEIQAIYNASGAGKCVPPPAPTCVALPSALVSWWRAESNTTDTVSSNNGTLYGNTAYGSGRVGGAFVLDGSSDAVPVGSPTNLQLQNFTIEAWIKRGSSAIASLDPWGDGAIFDSSWGGYSFAIRDDGRLQLGKIGYSSVSSTHTVTDTSSFHHVAVTKSGSSVTLYVDGVGDAVGPYDPGFEFGGPFAVGARGGDYVGSFLGSIDELSIYNRGLSAAEIQSIYNASSAGKCPPAVEPTCTTVPSNLVSWWKGENNPIDQVGTNHGTLAGGATYAPGRVGQGFMFDGTGGYFSSVASDSLRFTNNVSVAAWIFPTGPGQAPEGGVIANREGEYVLARFPDGSIRWAFANQSPGWAWTSSGGVAPVDQWSHIALTYSNGLASTFINGQLVQSYSGSGLIGDIYPSLNEFRIGGRQAVSQGFAGVIDEVSVFSRALTSSEIAAIYTAGSLGMCITQAAPYITIQPASQTVVVGDDTSFSMVAGGTPPLSYQWLRNGTNLSGATASSLSLTNVQSTQAGDYSVQITNLFGSINSSNALLTVNPQPPCFSAPSDLVSWWRAESNVQDHAGVNNGTLVGNTGYGAGRVGQTFVLDGSGDAVSVGNPVNLRLQNFSVEAWIKRSDTALATKSGEGAGHFFGGGFGAYVFGLQDDGRLTLGKIGESGIISSGRVTNTANFHHVAVTKTGSVVAFYVDGVGETAAAYDPGFQFGGGGFAVGARGGDYGAGFWGSLDEVSVYNRALSAAEVQSAFNAGSAGKCPTPIAPFILMQPANKTVTVGGNASFSVLAGGTAPLGYQWLFNGTNIDGATGTSFTVTNAQFSNAGSYSVLVTNAAVDSILSSNASLTVNPMPSVLRVGNASAPSGATVIVPVLLTANGFENSLSFTLNFNPSRLTYVGATVGGGSSATLLINDSGSSTGRVGLLFGLGGENTFPPGTQELAQVTFTSAIVTNPVSTLISFVDGPIPKQVSGVHGNVLQATYTNGTVSITAADFEADVTPPPDGNKDVTVSDWSLIGRFAAHLESPTNATQFQRADCAPRGTLGNGSISITDWVQAGRYAARLDPLTIVGGPDSPGSFAFAASKSYSRKSVGNRQLIAMDANVNQAHTATVSISLQSQGDENALGFSVSFDPSKLSYKGATLGSAANGSILNVNTAEVAAGRLGIALAVPSGTHLVTGLDELVKVSFQPALSSTGAVSIVLTNGPIDREISDAGANVLTAEYLNGTLTINPLPSLKISQAGPNINLSWESWATNFALQEIGAFSGTWSNVNATVSTTSSENSVTLPMNATTRFYRLFQQ